MKLSHSGRSIVVTILVGLAFVLSGKTAPAQSPELRSNVGFGVSPDISFLSGGTTFLPFGTSSGGFVPYTAGPGGGLGVQSRMTQPSARSLVGAMGGMGGTTGSALGQARGALTPLAPIRITGGMAGGSMIQRGPVGGGMNAMSRPPVGFYPFRQPPSLTGPGAPSPSMSM